LIGSCESIEGRDMADLISEAGIEGGRNEGQAERPGGSPNRSILLTSGFRPDRARACDKFSLNFAPIVL
jgi:hypothetical protein